MNFIQHKDMMDKSVIILTSKCWPCRASREAAALAEANLDVARQEVLVRRRGRAARNAERARGAELALRDNELHSAELAAGRNERLAEVTEETARRGDHHRGIDTRGRRRRRA